MPVTLDVSRGDGGVDEGEESGGVERRSGGARGEFCGATPSFPLWATSSPRKPTTNTTLMDLLQYPPSSILKVI